MNDDSIEFQNWLESIVIVDEERIPITPVLTEETDFGKDNEEE